MRTLVAYRRRSRVTPHPWAWTAYHIVGCVLWTLVSAGAILDLVARTPAPWWYRIPFLLACLLLVRDHWRDAAEVRRPDDPPPPG